MVVLKKLTQYTDKFSIGTGMNWGSHGLRKCSGKRSVNAIRNVMQKKTRIGDSMDRAVTGVDLHKKSG